MKQNHRIIAGTLVVAIFAFLAGKWYGGRIAARYYLWDEAGVINALAMAYADSSQKESTGRLHSQMIMTNLQRRITLLSNSMIIRVPSATGLSYPSLSLSEELESLKGYYARLDRAFARTGNLLLPDEKTKPKSEPVSAP